MIGSNSSASSSASNRAGWRSGQQETCGENSKLNPEISIDLKFAWTQVSKERNWGKLASTLAIEGPIELIAKNWG
jgi:hypothetical protein